LKWSLKEGRKGRSPRALVLIPRGQRGHTKALNMHWEKKPIKERRTGARVNGMAAGFEGGNRRKNAPSIVVGT